MVCQSAPALDILLPGSACGMPYAPLAFSASYRQPLSRFQMSCRQPK